MSHFKKIEPSVCLAEGITEDCYDMRLCLESSQGLKPCRLFLVTLSRRGADGSPSTSMHYVLAPDEQQAIYQCDAHAAHDLPEHQQGTTSAKAIPLPLLIRGWGFRLF